MTHVAPGGGTSAPPAFLSLPSTTIRSPAQTAPLLDRTQIRDRIAQHRALLAELESALVAACEAAAARHRTGAVSVDDRATWDRAMWQRYLDAATVLEPQYGPPMRDLLRDIDRLERLLTLPVARERIAA